MYCTEINEEGTIRGAEDHRRDLLFPAHTRDEIWDSKVKDACTTAQLISVVTAKVMMRIFIGPLHLSLNAALHIPSAQSVVNREIK